MASIRTRAPEVRPIAEVAAELGLTADEVEPYGRYKAKIPLEATDRRVERRDGSLVCVTSMTPTKSGEGKTTTAISLADGLGLLGASTLLCLREPSLGPVFGIKGGGAGGGRAQLHPLHDVNLHFTGDLHAVAAANNLLAALIDAHLVHGNALGLEPHSLTWRRCLDVNDRALRNVVVGLGGAANGVPRETGFDITAASEVMAILATARDLGDLRRRLGAITVGRSRDGEPMTAERLGAAGAMTVLLRDALKPNLVQTAEGRPALVHCGPFANVAHGNNSLAADLLALKLADVVVTESGFGSDLGFEKLAHIVARAGGLSPAAVVLVATVKATEEHGVENLERHVELVERFGFEPVVAVNRFPGDTDLEVEEVCAAAIAAGARSAAVADGYARGGEGSVELAAAVLDALAEPGRLRFLYPLEAPVEDKLDTLAREVYGADGVALSPQARRQAEQLERDGLGGLPICVAKTPLSLSHDPALRGAPRGFTLPVRELRPYTGAGWHVALTGDVMTMPGLPADPAAHRIDVDEHGRTVGLA